MRALLFYSPTCPHCEEVIRRDLPPLIERHGDRLRIVAFNSSVPEGHEAYEEAVRVLEIPPSRRGVPLLVVGDEHLVGSAEIPERFPAIVERGLASGGIDWPALPGVRELLAEEGLLAEAAADPRPADPPVDPPVDPPAADPAVADPVGRAAGPGPETRKATDAEPPAPSESQPEPGPEPAVDVLEPAPAPEAESATREAPAPTPGPSLKRSGAAARLTVDGEPPRVRSGPLDRFRMDPVGNTASVLVLLGLLGALGWSVAAAAGRAVAPRLAPWLVPLFAVAGLLVAAYLSWVETTGSEAVCGPVGDCNTVQQSEYARLLGVPVGLLGVAGYLMMLGAWLAAHRAERTAPHRALRARRLLWAAALVATAYSAWLTFLEPFVIGATCAWCLTSALLVAAIFVAATRPAWPRRS